ncbi:MAG: AAA family ATPase [Gammaproteobacteria bacterium]|nr:AAA family ATPase [Gammaproteobacteria bacterium]
MKYIPRCLESTITKYLSIFPVIGLTGPRQSGKSTLLRHLLPKYTYVSFDDPKVIDYLQEDPEGFINHYSHQVIFDEIQYVPRLFHYIKILVDRNRQDYGKFVLTASSQFNLLANISESLAGRIGLLSLLYSGKKFPLAGNIDVINYQDYLGELKK